MTIASGENIIKALHNSALKSFLATGLIYLHIWEEETETAEIRVGTKGSSIWVCKIKVIDNIVICSTCLDYIKYDVPRYKYIRSNPERPKIFRRKFSLLDFDLVIYILQMCLKRLEEITTLQKRRPLSRHLSLVKTKDQLKKWQSGSDRLKNINPPNNTNNLGDFIGLDGNLDEETK